MAYNKSERFQKIVTQTPACVGPSTYYLSDLTKPPRHLETYYPFLCGASRNTLETLKGTCSLPGPGAYNPKWPTHIPESRLNKGGVSINFTDARFKTVLRDEPGPCEYVQPDSTFKVPGPMRCHEAENIPLHSDSNICSCPVEVGKLWLTRPPRSVVYSGISVPSKNDNNGYDINEYGQLTKNPSIKQEPIYFYNIPGGETNFTTLRYKGNFWSKMTGREVRKVDDTPSPGDYQNEKEIDPAKIETEKIREMKRATATQLRYMDVLNRQKLRESIPAPNNYCIPKGPFDILPKNHCKCGRDYIKPPSFNNTAPRFETKIASETPGPQAYNIQNRMRCGVFNFCAAFGARSGRFKKASLHTGPSPGDHYSSFGNLAYECAKRSKYKRTQAFIKPTRLIQLHKERLYLETCYGAQKNVKSYVYHAAFKSRIDRFPDASKRARKPDPGAYEALVAFKANRDRCDFHCRDVAPPFDSRMDRFPKKRGNIDILLPDLSNDISQDVKGGVILYPRKVIVEKSTGPGPAHYSMHPYVASSVLKKTFNVTLGKTASEVTARESCSMRRLSLKNKLERTRVRSRKYEQYLTACY